MSMVGSAGFLESQIFWSGSILIANFVMSAKIRKGGGQPRYSIIFVSSPRADLSHSSFREPDPKVPLSGEIGTGSQGCYG